MEEDFKKYLDQNVPLWKLNLSSRDYKELQILYNEVQFINRRVNSLTDLASKSQDDTDFMMDLQRITTEQSIAQNKLAMRTKEIFKSFTEANSSNKTLQ